MYNNTSKCQVNCNQIDEHFDFLQYTQTFDPFVNAEHQGASVYWENQTRDLTNKPNQISFISSNLTPTEKKVLYYILDRTRDFRQSLSNREIARKVGCTERTVGRATKKLHENGIIKKSEGHRWHPNIFRPCIDNQTSYVLMLNRKYKAPVTFRTPVCLSRKKIANENYVHRDINYIYLKNKPIHPKSRLSSEGYEVEGHVRFAENPEAARQHKLKNRNLYQAITLLRQGIKMLPERDREYIAKNKDHPYALDVIMTPEIRKLIIIPEVDELMELCGFNLQQGLKFIAFTDQVIRLVLDTMKKRFEAEKGKGIDDLYSYAIGLCNQYTKSSQYSTYWGWYTIICKIMKIDPKARYDALPLAGEVKVRNVVAVKAHAPQKAQQEDKSPEKVKAVKSERVLLDEIIEAQDRIDNPEKYLTPAQRYMAEAILSEMRSYQIIAMNNLLREYIAIGYDQSLLPKSNLQKELIRRIAKYVRNFNSSDYLHGLTRMYRNQQIAQEKLELNQLVHEYKDHGFDVKELDKFHLELL